MVIDPEAGAEVATLRVHDRYVFSLAFAADGATVFTSGQDAWIGATDLNHLRRYVLGNAMMAASDPHSVLVADDGGRPSAP